MKIGILTFANAYNYGAVLQCYALYKTLSDNGFDVSVINYRPYYMNPRFPRPPLRVFLKFQFIKGVRIYRDSVLFYTKFKDFISSNTVFTRKCSNFEQINLAISDYDYIVLGSDQVWTKKHNKFDPVWYGGYGKAQWIGYAVSAGDCLFQNDEIDRFQDCLKKYKAISVREDILSKFIKTVINRGAPVVLDPTLLADRNIWNKWTKPILDEKYILVYQARQSNKVFSVAEKLSMEIGNCKIIPVCGWPNVYESGYKRFCASPSDFISLIKNAQYVVTTSFHATAFSIILGTQFFTVKLNDGADERCEHLLQLLDLKMRLVESDDFTSHNTIDFQLVYEKLDKYRLDSMNFIVESLT